MAYLFTEASRAGVPIAYNFTFGGVAVDWGTLYLTDMSDVSMRSEPLDGKFSVSELRTSFSDTTGLLWGSFGHGTVGLGSTWSATVYIGGTMDADTRGPSETFVQRQNTVGAGTYVIHTGKITEISRRNRILTVVSQNVMGQVEDLEWRFPVNGAQTGWGSRFGSMFFQSGYTATNAFQNRPAFFNINNEDNEFEGYAFIGPSFAPLSTAYPTPSGRGTMGVITGSGFFYPGTQFYYDFTRVLFKGTYFATITGSITDEAQAQGYGYANVEEAEAAKVSGSYYPNRTRLTLNGEVPTNFTGSQICWQQVLTLANTPAYLWQEMLTGCCVTPLFGSSSIDGDTLATARRNTAYQSQAQTIDPKGGKVLPYIKNLLEPLRALWSVSSANTFRFYTFGPKTLADVLGTIGSSEILESQVQSNEADKVTRIAIDYGYKFDTGSYSKRLELKATAWGSTNDHLFEMKSQWLNNDNDARITGQRILSRFSRGQPKLSLEVPLTRLGADVGSLFAIYDDDLLYNNKTFEVIGWHRNFTGDRTIQLELWDGEALYGKKGYAKWEGDNSLTKTVSGTSTSGWGTNGTVNNINATFYGSVFVWF